jgi:hypothetical protein
MLMFSLCLYYGALAILKSEIKRRVSINGRNLSYVPGDS